MTTLRTAVCLTFSARAVLAQTAINPATLRTHLYAFAADSMMGREAGTAGNVKATNYLARELRRIGLQPAGDDGTYFQTLPFKERTAAATSTLVINGQRLAWRSEWHGIAQASAHIEHLRVIYAGTEGDSTPAQLRARAAGALVVQRESPDPNAYDDWPNAGATALVVDDSLLDPARPVQQFVDDPVASRARYASSPELLLTTHGVEHAFGKPIGRLVLGDSGEATLDLVMDIRRTAFPARNVVAILRGRDPTVANEYIALGAHSDHVGIAKAAVDHDSLRIFNHLVRPRGVEDAPISATPAQFQAVNRELAAYRAAHPGTARRDSIFNGADDDGSGSVALLAIAQHLASLRGSARPRRSVLFVWHTAEELGLLGAEYFVNHPTVPRDSIVAELTMDNVGRGGSDDQPAVTASGTRIQGNSNFLMVIGARRLSSELDSIIGRVNADGRHGLQFDYTMDAAGHPAGLFCRSDHAQYNRVGIPVAFFTTGANADLHQVTDEPQYIDYDHMARVTSFVDDVAQRLANMDHRLVLDRPLPNPKSRCRQ
jgi:peptidase M28-like protein